MSMGDSPAGRGSLGVTDLLQAAQVRHYYDTVTAFSITAYTITAYTITTSLLQVTMSIERGPDLAATHWNAIKPELGLWPLNSFTSRMKHRMKSRTRYTPSSPSPPPPPPPPPPHSNPRLLFSVSSSWPPTTRQGGHIKAASFHIPPTGPCQRRQSCDGSGDGTGGRGGSFPGIASSRYAGPFRHRASRNEPTAATATAATAAARGSEEGELRGGWRGAVGAV